ncbi:hypothetical protein [Latilactobacillus curvatus]
MAHAAALVVSEEPGVYIIHFFYTVRWFR